MVVLTKKIPIAYRVWVKSLRELHQVTKIDLTKERGAFPIIEHEVTYHLGDPNYVTMAQVEGVLDSRGLLVYEGDILHYCGEDYANQFFTIELHLEKNLPEDFLNKIAVSKVIGNIYQDPWFQSKERVIQHGDTGIAFKSLLDSTQEDISFEEAERRLRILRELSFFVIQKSLLEDGHCKSYEGTFSIGKSFPNYFESSGCGDGSGWFCTYDCYLFCGEGRGKTWKSTSLDLLTREMRADFIEWLGEYYTDGGESYLQSKDPELLKILGKLTF